MKSTGSKSTQSGRLTIPRILGLAALAVAASAVPAIATLYAMRKRRNTAPAEEARQAEQIPIQPSVDTAMPAELPHHFSEDLLVPGMTLTGQETIEQDNALGRSPEGV